MSAPTDREVLEMALSYVRQGWPVFPVYPPSLIKGQRCHCSKGKKCSSPGKHPVAAAAPHGLLSASSDEKQVRAWWKEYPDANIGIVCGAVSGLAVVDVDPKNEGPKTLRLLEKKHGKLPLTPTVRTGSMDTGGSVGRHYYFAHPGGKVTSRKGFQPGMDSQADGAYVVAPPSLHKSGKRYKWEVAGSVPLAPMPEWLLALIPKPKSKRSARKSGKPGEPDTEGKDEFNDGERHVGLYSLAGALRHWGAGEKMIYAALSGINEECVEPPLEEEEIASMARSISYYSN